MQKNIGIIYHVEFAKTGLGVSGGEKCMVENIKYFLSKGFKNILLTTDNGKEVYEKLGLLENDLLNYKIIESYDYEKKHHVFFSYINRLKLIKKLIKYININNNDIIFCHSDFFPNSIGTYLLSRKNIKSNIYFYFHMKSPNIFRGYEGEFLKKYNFPSLGLIHYKLNQLLYFNIIKRISKGTIISVNSFYFDYLEKIFYNTNIKIFFLKIFGGVDNKIELLKDKKKYDCIWMGRFHKQKGLNELFNIAIKLKEKNNNIKIVVIGGGDEKLERNFINKIKEYSLEKNIIYKGFINGEERFKILSQSKIFLMTSYFESYGLVNIEAMKFGLPVVAYDLPVFEVFQKGMIKVNILDNKSFSEEILDLLNDINYYRSISSDALNFSSDYSWLNTGKEIYNLIKR